MVAASAPMRGISDLIERIGSQDLPVLIRGETGTGKELIARAVHEQSRRSRALFLPINCCALPEELLDSELFGHVKGAFTGATSAARGLFQQASGGTLFLDEIGDISPRLQTKLLRVLQDKVIRQVGGERQIEVDVRIIAATNRNLEAAVESGEFRRDLFFRLNVLPITVPPLRERLDDVVPLIALFVDRIRRRTGRPELRVTDAALKRLSAYDWPGNARQLENIIERAFAMTTGDVLDEAQLLFDSPPACDGKSTGNAPRHPAAGAAPPEPAKAATTTLEEETLKHIRAVLAAHDGNQVAAARALGISRTTLRRRLGLGL
jgi:transcriptional regulator with PAS, ATPase and Fis domain